MNGWYHLILHHGTGHPAVTYEMMHCTSVITPFFLGSISEPVNVKSMFFIWLYVCIRETEDAWREKEDVLCVYFIAFTDCMLRLVAVQKYSRTSLLLWRKKEEKDRVTVLGDVGIWITISKQWTPNLLSYGTNYSKTFYPISLQNRCRQCFYIFCFATQRVQIIIKPLGLEERIIEIYAMSSAS